MNVDKLLVLDLDETLIYATTREREQPADFRVGAYYVYKRPHVDRFLALCMARFTIGVWTSASPLYAAGVVRHLFTAPDQLRFVWAADRCTRVYDAESGDYYWRKNLVKLCRRGYRREAIVAVDDTPQKWERSYGNLVRVAPFFGDPGDIELPLLAAYLEELRSAPNVRTIEKRGWRASLATLPLL